MKLVKISAEWCKSCKNVENVFEILKEEFDNIEYENLDYDLLNNKDEVTKIPMFTLYDKSTKLSSLVSTNPSEVFQWVQKSINTFEPLDSF